MKKTEQPINTLYGQEFIKKYSINSYFISTPKLNGVFMDLQPKSRPEVIECFRKRMVYLLVKNAITLAVITVMDDGFEIRVDDVKDADDFRDIMQFLKVQGIDAIPVEPKQFKFITIQIPAEVNLDYEVINLTVLPEYGETQAMERMNAPTSTADESISTKEFRDAIVKETK